MIINLTQHQSTPDQKAAGVVDLEGEDLDKLKKQLTFLPPSPPNPGNMQFRAKVIALIAFRSGAKKAMIGGAMYFQGPLARALIRQGITPLWAFTERKVKEVTQPDGSVRKYGVFKHLGFVRDQNLEASTKRVRAALDDTKEAKTWALLDAALNIYA